MPQTQPTPEARLYARAMSQWALDLLHLRREGLLAPSARGGSPDHAPPALAFHPATAPGPTRAERALLHWRPVKRAA